MHLFVSEDRTLKFISVEYDKLMPFDVEKALIEVSEKVCWWYAYVLLAKLIRSVSELFQCITNYINFAITNFDLLMFWYMYFELQFDTRFYY